MQDINVFGNLHLSSGSMSIADSGIFPTAPKLGRFALVAGVLYIYASVKGVETWYPLTNKRNVHIHQQAMPNTTWVINHDLASVDLIFMVYDLNDQVQQVSPVFSSPNRVTLNFEEAIAGRAVFFVANEEFMQAVSTNRVEVGQVVIEGSSITVAGTDIVQQLNAIVPPTDWKLIADNYDASDGDRLLVDTTAAPYTVALPLNPLPDAEVLIGDLAGTFATKNLTVGRSGQKINGLSEDFVIDISRATVSLVFTSAAYGWVVMA